MLFEEPKRYSHGWMFSCPVARVAVARVAVACFAFVGCSKTPDTTENVERPAAAETSSINGSIGDTSSRVISADELVTLAERSGVSGDWLAADNYLRRALMIEPDEARIVFLAAQVTAIRGDKVAAIDLMLSIDEADPEFGFAATTESARWLSGVGRVNEAKKKYERALAFPPNNHELRSEELRHEYVGFLNSVGWRFQARDAMLPLLEAGDATEIELRALLDLSNSYAATQLTHDGNPVKREGPLSWALGSLSERKPRTAIQTLTRFLDANVIAPDAATDAVLAAAYADLQQFDEVDRILEKRSEELERNPLFWRAVGDKLRFQGDTESSVAAYRRSLELDSSNQISHERMMACLMQLGHVDQARAVEDRNQQLALMGQAVQAIGQDQPDDLRAGMDLVADLIKVGYALQAANWMVHLTNRHGQEAVASLIPATDLMAEINRLRSIPAEQSLGLQLCGLESEPWVTTASESLDLATKQLANPKPKTKTTPGLDPPSFDPSFVNVATARGLQHRYRNAAEPRRRNFQIYESLGAGVAAIDYDRNGEVDFYFGQAGCVPPHGKSERSNTLFRNTDQRFNDVSTPADATDFNYSLGITAGDLNQDGWPDLVIGNLGLNRILINQGDGTFRDRSIAAGWQDPNEIHCTSGLGVADVNGDGIADIVEINYVNDPEMYKPSKLGPDGHPLELPGPLIYTAESDRIWIQSDDGELASLDLASTQDAELPTEVVNQSQSSASRANTQRFAALGDAANPSLGLIVSDIDNRPGIEIFVANDARPNQLWVRDSSINSRRSQDSLNTLAFQDAAVARGLAFSSRGEANACMGVAWADLDGNGMPDLTITNWIDEWMNLYLINDDGYCRDAAPRFGLDRLSEGLLGFGSQAIDFDNNSRIDLFVGNGHIEDLAGDTPAFAMPSQLLINRGGHFELAEPARVDSVADDYWLADHLSRCAITADYNRDGKTDMVVVDLLDDAVLLENQTESTHHWLQLELVGVGSERDAIGARVNVTTARSTQTFVTATGDGYQGKNEPVVMVGLGADEEPVDVTIQWPNGEKTELRSVASDHRYLIVQGNAIAWER